VEIKTALKASVAAAALLAFTAPVDAVAGGKVSANNSKIDFKLGGRIHRSIIALDDGEHDDIFQTAGISGNSEIWMTGSGKITESTTMGGYVRWDIPKEQSGFSFGSVTGAGAVTAGNRGTNDKYEYIYFKNASMGTLSFGDMEPGADGTMNGNYGSRPGDDGASMSGADITLSAGGWTNDEASAYVGIIDPASGGSRIRYDSPSFSGLSVHGDVEYGGGGSIGAKWSGSVSGLTVKAGIGMENDGAGGETTGFSIAAKHASGLHAAINYGETDADDSTLDPEWRRAVVGYEAAINSLGKTNISVFVSEKEDETTLGNEGDMLSVGISQALDSVGGAIKFQYDNYSFSNAAAEDMNDIDAMVLEMSFNF